MSILIKGMEMPTKCADCLFIDYFKGQWYCHSINDILETGSSKRDERCNLVPVPPHGDLIDRDALIKDGWLNLHKEVIRMGGYAIHELPLKNPSIPVIIPAEEGE